MGLLPNALAKQAAREAGAYEAWLVDERGLVTEGASTNAWIVDADGALRTRDTKANILRVAETTMVFDNVRTLTTRIARGKGGRFATGWELFGLAGNHH